MHYPRLAHCLVLTVASCAPRLLDAQTAPAPSAPAEHPSAAAPADNSPLLALLWMQRGAEYRAACRQSYRAAAAALPPALNDTRWSACLEQSGQPEAASLPPAVIVDVDETVLDNTPFAARQLQKGITAFDFVAWTAWVHEQRAAAVPGALAYLNAAAALGVHVVYVTDRASDSNKEGAISTAETDTRANLARLGFPIVEAPGEDCVLTAGEFGDKSARRREVCKHYRILQLVGDNLGDFADGTNSRKKPPTQSSKAAEAELAERTRNALANEFANWWGERWILIPNPSYGGWERVLQDQYEDLGKALRTD